MSVNPFESPHFKAISAIYPLQTDEEHYAFGKEMDRLKAVTDEILAESLPTSCTMVTLARWEEVYGLSGTGTFDERKQKLIEAYNANVGIAERHYKALAASIGFNVTITPPPKVFRVGVSRVGDKIYNDDEIFTWTVQVNNHYEEVQILMDVFERNKIPFTEIRWQLKTRKLFKLADGKNLKLANGKYLILEDNDD